MILLIDNFDSFTYNLVDYLNQFGTQVRTVRNNTPLEEIRKENYKGIILSPGPGIPSQAGNLGKIIEAYYKELPILGICLGHQALAEFFGAVVKKASRPMHGKISEITISIPDPLFKDIPTSFKAVRYHSLLVNELTPNLQAIAFTAANEVMAIKHKHLPIYGIQYHPEAALTEYGKKLLENWLFINRLID